MQSREAELADHDFIDGLDRIVSRDNLLYPYPEARFGYFFAQHMLYMTQKTDKKDFRRTEIATNITTDDVTAQQWNSRFRLVGSRETGPLGFYALRDWGYTKGSDRQKLDRRPDRELWFAAVAPNSRRIGVFKQIIIDALNRALLEDKASRLIVRPKSSPSWLINFLIRENFEKLENDPEGRVVMFFDLSNIRIAAAR